VPAQKGRTERDTVTREVLLTRVPVWEGSRDNWQ